MSAGSPVVPGARHTVVPAGIVATAWPKVSQTCRNIGWRFDPWQDAAGRLILAKRDGGRWAADLSILSIPRQVGKSYLLGCIIFALCLLNPRLRVIWTSHHTATTEEMFEAMKELAQHKRVAPHVTKCIALQGSRWRIQFRNGSRIDFGARSQGFGRGKARVGVLVLDEFQHISSRALSNLAPTTNTAENPLILCAGTPPGPDANGEAFAMRRKAALEGISDDTLYVEFSADADADLDDRKQWAKANPSFPKRTKERAFLLLRKVLEEEDFRREALGVWGEVAVSTGAFPPGAWNACRADAPDGDPVAFTVDMTWDREWADIATAIGDYVDIVEHRRGAAWVVDTAKALKERYGDRPWWVDPNGPARTLIEPLREAGILVEEMPRSEYKLACGDFFDAVNEGRLTHSGHPALDAAVAGAVVSGGLGGWVWDRKKGAVISPLVAATIARHAAQQAAAFNVW